MRTLVATSIRLAFAASVLALGCSSESAGSGSAAANAPAPAPTGTVSGAPAASSAPSADPSASATPKTDPPADPFASSLTVYAIHAPTSQLNPAGLMWTSPGGLTRQVLLNEAGAAVLNFKHTIGHASVKLECAATPSAPAGKFVGAMTNADDTELRGLVLDKQVGLGVMFDSVKGRFQTEAEVQADVAAGIKDGGMSYVKFGLAADVCQRLLDYERAYVAAGLDKVYGLAVSPLKKEGAGCSAFAVSFLELANLLEPRFASAWAFRVRAPMYTQPLVGSPEPLIGGTRNPGVLVPVTRVASLTRGWAAANEDGIDIAGWDPTEMQESLDKIITQAVADGSEKVEVQGKLRGLLLDRRSIAATPALMNGTFFSP